jgi:hypothetical protein
MIQAFPFQWRPSTAIVDPKTGILTQYGQYLLLALYNRTGDGSGIPLSVGNDLEATGATQQTALGLTNDYNEVLTGSGGGVALLALKPGQSQIVFNGSGGNIDVYPPAGSQIDSDGVNDPYLLGNDKTQIFTCWGLLASGAPYYRSLQLG